MASKRMRRAVMILMFLGGPIGGWLLRGDRGAMFGLAVSVLAIIWFLLEQRRIV